MTETLIAYSTVDGQTRRIAECLQACIEAQSGQRVTLARVEAAMSLDLAGFDRLVLGASIRYGRYRPEVLAFVNAHQALLEQRASAFFTVNVVARKPGRDLPDTNPYCRRFLEQSPWRPRLVGVFAGRIDYPSYGLLDRLMIRLIMRLTQGPTDTRAAFEFTDWARVRDFGARLAEL